MLSLTYTIRVGTVLRTTASSLRAHPAQNNRYRYVRIHRQLALGRIYFMNDTICFKT